MNDVPWWTKACVGILGGIALALLKLINANFYVQAPAVVLQAAYLSFAAYMALGGMAAVFLADHDLPPRKIVRDAFVIGLLAPSLLLALVSQPIRVAPQAPDAEKMIPRLSLAPFSAAMADQPSTKAAPAAEPAQTVSSGTEIIKVTTLPSSALEPSFLDALNGVIGRDYVPEKYVYVIGSTVSKEKAATTAELVNKVLSSRTLKPSIIQIKGQSQYFVTIGGFVNFESAYKIKAESAAAVTKSLTGEQSRSLSAAERNKLAAMFADAPVVKTKALWSSE